MKKPRPPFNLTMVMLIVLSGMTLSLCAQNDNLDSLEVLLSENIPDSTKLMIYRQVIWPKTRTDSDAALVLTDSLYSLSRRMGSEKGELLSYYYYGTALKNQGKFPESLSYFEKYYNHYLSMNDTAQITNVLYQIAVVSEGMGDYAKSMDSYNQCIAFERVLGRTASLATTISARASLFKNLNQIGRAIEGQKEAMALYESAGDQSGVARCLLNLGNLFVDQGKIEMAFDHYNQAEEIALKNEDLYLLGFIHENRGNTRVSLGDYGLALRDYQRSLDIRRTTGRIKEQAVTENKIAELYNLTGNYTKAIELAQLALQKAREQKMLPEIEVSHRTLATAYKKLRRYREALADFESYSTVKDSILNQNISRQIAEMDARFETTQKQAEIERLSLEGRLQDDKLQNQKIALIATLAALGILAVLLWNINAKSRQIKLQKEQIEKSLTEKEFLLKEIHHRVKNNLQVISSLLKLQSKSLTDKHAQLALDEGRNRVRSMALIHQNLYQKDNLSGIRMPDYIDQLTSELIDTYRTGKCAIALELDIENIMLDVDTAVPIGLIINELVSNSLKHGFPGKKDGTIRIELTYSGEILNLVVSDDGVGFRPEESSATSFGHRLVTSFAERLQADYTLDGSRGTRATFLIRDFKLAA